MPVIKVQKIETKKRYQSIDAEETLARFCYYFPQYTYTSAKKMPYKRIIQMLNIALCEKAKEWKILLEIFTAPHTKNGEGVKNLVSKLDEIIEGK